MSADWAAVWTNALGAVANFVVAAIAIWAVLRQRADQITDRAKEEQSRISAALSAAELAAYEIQTTYWELDAAAKSAARAKFSGPLDYSLRTAALHRRASTLDLINDGRLPIQLVDHIAGVTGLVRSAIDTLESLQDVNDLTFGQTALGPLLTLRHHADLEHDTNARL